MVASRHGSPLADCDSLGQRDVSLSGTTLHDARSTRAVLRLEHGRHAVVDARLPASADVLRAPRHPPSLHRPEPGPGPDLPRPPHVTLRRPSAQHRHDLYDLLPELLSTVLSAAASELAHAPYAARLSVASRQLADARGRPADEPVRRLCARLLPPAGVHVLAAGTEIGAARPVGTDAPAHIDLQQADDVQTAKRAASHRPETGV